MDHFKAKLARAKDLARKLDHRPFRKVTPKSKPLPVSREKTRQQVREALRDLEEV